MLTPEVLTRHKGPTEEYWPEVCPRLSAEIRLRVNIPQYGLNKPG